MPSSAVRKRNMERRTMLVYEFCTQYQFEVVALNIGYQLRVEGLMDIYPVGGYWHWLSDGERGSWDKVEDLRKIMLRKLPAFRKGDPEKYGNSERPMRPLTKSEVGAIYDDARRLEGKQPTGPADWDGVNTVQIRSVTPGQLGSVEGLKIMNYADYNSWYRRLWRKLRRRAGDES